MCYSNSNDERKNRRKINIDIFREWLFNIIIKNDNFNFSWISKRSQINENNENNIMKNDNSKIIIRMNIVDKKSTNKKSKFNVNSKNSFTDSIRKNSNNSNELKKFIEMLAKNWNQFNNSKFQKFDNVTSNSMNIFLRSNNSNQFDNVDNLFANKICKNSKNSNEEKKIMKILINASN